MNGRSHLHGFSDLNELLKLAANEAINLPYVILSHFDLAFKNAASNAFSDSMTKHQMCLWHIMKDIAHNKEQSWENLEEELVAISNTRLLARPLIIAIPK